MIVPLLFANSIIQKQDVERKRALKQAQGPVNLHKKSWKKKDHLANEKASKTGEGGENSQRRKKKKSKISKRKI